MVDKKLQLVVGKIIELAKAYQVLGNDKMYDEMMHMGSLIKEVREELKNNST